MFPHKEKALGTVKKTKSYFYSCSVAPGCCSQHPRAGLSWCVLAHLAAQWLREGQPLGGTSGAATPASLSRFAASQAVRDLNGYRESSFWSSQSSQEAGPQWGRDRIGPCWELAEGSWKGRAGQAGALSSPPESTTAAQALPQHINSFLHLAELACLETITCKRSSFTNVAVHWSSVLWGWALSGLLPAKQRKAPANPQWSWAACSPLSKTTTKRPSRKMQWGEHSSLENKATLTSLNKATVFFPSGRAGWCLPSPGQTVFRALRGHVGGRLFFFCCAAPVLGSPCCYQELKSPKPVLFFSFFAAVLVEGPSSSTLRFLEPKWKQLSGTIYCSVGPGQLVAFPLPATSILEPAHPLSIREECKLHASMGTAGGWGWGPLVYPKRGKVCQSAGMVWVRLWTLPGACSKPNKFSRSERKI